MSKIVQAMNAMISNSHEIDNVIRGTAPNELFFRYKKKHKWSIIKHQQDQYSIHYYPGDSTLEQLSMIEPYEWEDGPEIVSYSSKDLGTKEALDSFKELYVIVQEKLYGMDRVLDDIIGDDLPF